MKQENIDELLSDYFKSKMRHPWPAPPAPPFTEPSSLRESRGAAHSGNRARVTLAASVAILIGACWFFSNGSQPAERGPAKPVPGGPGILNDGSAKTPDEFKKNHPIHPKVGGLPAAPVLN
jgi:hypothetical protein